MIIIIMYLHTWMDDTQLYSGWWRWYRHPNLFHITSPAHTQATQQDWEGEKDKFGCPTTTGEKKKKVSVVVAIMLHRSPFYLSCSMPGVLVVWQVYFYFLWSCFFHHHHESFSLCLDVIFGAIPYQASILFFKVKNRQRFSIFYISPCRAALILFSTHPFISPLQRLI